MKQFNFSATLFLVWICFSALSAEVQTWTSTAGSQIEAELVDVDSGGSIALREEDGRTLHLVPDPLSSDDQKSLNTLEQAPVPAARKAAPLKILFVGNSYTNGIRGVFEKFIDASPYADTQLKFATKGGVNLKQHFEKLGTVKVIQSQAWDFVVLQDQSQTPAVFTKRFLKASIRLDEIIDKRGAQTVFYQTWGRRDGDRDNFKRFPTYWRMQKALTKAYDTAAKKTEGVVAPVGEAWSRVRREKPNLGKSLYQSDGSHPSKAGAYLAASVFYATLFKAHPNQSTFTGEMTEADSAYLKKIAWETVNSHM